MSIFNVDFSDLGLKLLPPDKRYPQTTAWVKQLLSSLQYLNDLLFSSIKTGSTAPAYVSGTYSQYSRVIYKKAVYESLINANTALPTVTTSWRRVQDNYLGVDERLQYNGQKLVFEYALNKWFGTTFRQPGGSNSDIYISNATLAISPFVVGGSAENSSDVFARYSTEYVINSYSMAPAYNMTIHMPVAVYNALDTVAANRDSIVRAFADKYVLAGIKYNIQTY